MTLKRVAADTYECREDSTVLHGYNVFGILRCKNLVVVGYLKVRGLALADEIVVIGGSSIEVLTCDRAIFLTRAMPIVVDQMFSRELYSSGVRYPVIIHKLKAVNAALINTLVNEVEVKKLIMNKKTGIRELVRCDELVFNDPHCWIENIYRKPRKIRYNYSLT